MRKLITLIAISFSLAAFAQKKDSSKAVQYDTAFVFSIKDANELKSILMESKVVVNGNQLSGKELQQLFQWIDSRVRVFKKEQPK